MGAKDGGTAARTLLRLLSIAQPKLLVAGIFLSGDAVRYALD
jgi:hypothetical protein